MLGGIEEEESGLATEEVLTMEVKRSVRSVKMCNSHTETKCRSQSNDLKPALHLLLPSSLLAPLVSPSSC